jgi:hypothetical protein
MDAGVNVTPIVQACPAGTLDPQPLLDTAKFPLAATDEMANVVLR